MAVSANVLYPQESQLCSGARSLQQASNGEGAPVVTSRHEAASSTRGSSCEGHGHGDASVAGFWGGSQHAKLPVPACIVVLRAVFLWETFPKAGALQGASRLEDSLQKPGAALGAAAAFAAVSAARLA